MLFFAVLTEQTQVFLLSDINTYIFWYLLYNTAMFGCTKKYDGSTCNPHVGNERAWEYLHVLNPAKQVICKVN